MSRRAEAKGLGSDDESSGVDGHARWRRSLTPQTLVLIAADGEHGYMTELGEQYALSSFEYASAEFPVRSPSFHSERRSPSLSRHSHESARSPHLPTPSRSSTDNPNPKGAFHQQQARWRQSALPAMTSTPEPQTDFSDGVDTSFDESVLRALCELDVSTPHRSRRLYLITRPSAACPCSSIA